MSLEEPCDNFFELTLEKKRIVLDTPVILGFSVLQYAKLRMLQFYYDCIDFYIPRNSFQYIEMDTDSAYMALAGSLESVVKPELKRRFFEEYGEWFPRPYCSLHHQKFVDKKLQCNEWSMSECCK